MRDAADAACRQQTEGREFLRMFRDSGRYPTLFPDSDDALGDARLLNEYPDLERTSENGPIKHSLFNAFKMLRPVVVLDEAHKAYGAKNREANDEFVGRISEPARRRNRWQTGYRSMRNPQPRLDPCSRRTGA